MATDRTNDPRAFRDFLDAQLANGETCLTLDGVLGLWEYENQTDAEREETFQAIRQGITDADAGRVRPIEEFDREFREKHGLLPRT